MSERVVVIKPWHDCPKCPTCGSPSGTPIRATEGDRFYPPHDGSAPTLFCPACGQSWVGFPGEVEKAERAYAAWEAEELRSETAAKERAAATTEREKYERLMRGEW